MIKRLILAVIMLISYGCTTINQSEVSSSQSASVNDNSATKLRVAKAKAAINKNPKLFYDLIQSMRIQIRSNWIYPVHKKVLAKPKVLVKLDESANVVLAKIMESSGDVRFDESVLLAINKSSPIISLQKLDADLSELFSEFIIHFDPYKVGL